ncbi:ribosome maturation factor RimP [Kytococcus aerolatus]|uniref:Ribosome maturation factor RimP n=1 Tax=Kytococcus aerolatus TaxID=592308 RepID=A0A212U2F6_9MICO|nr:ribosome maturation factor RimP [Kytococcus aerolatus]SNC72306.1 ribosome maturation factor RimP [Kytococcus aerolatus]
MSTEERTEKVLGLSREALVPIGLEVREVEITPAGRRTVVRVLVERPLPDPDDGVTPVEPVDLDQVADATQLVSAAIDADDPFGAQPYTLEVSSPGVDRPLTELAHYRRAVGRLVELRGVEGTEPRTARVLRVEDELIVLADDAAEGGERSCTLAEAGTGTVQVEFRR